MGRDHEPTWAILRFDQRASDIDMPGSASTDLSVPWWPLPRDSAVVAGRDAEVHVTGQFHP